MQDFRDNKKISILVTTTILERGVTFPVDVIVLEANHRLFTRSALGQIGVASRKKLLERPRVT